MKRTHSTAEPVLAALRATAAKEEAVKHEMRLLLAYAREVAPKGLFTLHMLADATGLSTSTVRTCYDSRDVELAKDVVAREPTLT